MKRFKFGKPILFTFIGGITGLVLVGCSSTKPNSTVVNPEGRETPGVVAKADTNASSTISNSPVILTKAPENWRENNHIHGLAVNPQNPNILWVATHTGLLQRSTTGEWFWVGKERSDYMGFTVDPIESQRFYASGHPPTGGNLGFQISENQGQDWQLVSMPGVDFHALAIASRANSDGEDVFYGLAISGKKGLFTSKDGGKTWTPKKAVGLKDIPIELVGYPGQPNRVYAATRGGLYESKNGGDDWTLLPNTVDAPVIAIALVEDSASRTVMYGYRFLKSAPGLYRSLDSGKTWSPLGTGTQGVILKLAIPMSNPRIIYAANEANLIFQSQDEGKTWKEVR